MIVIMQLEQVLQVLFVCCSYFFSSKTIRFVNSVNLNYSNKKILQIGNPLNIYRIQSPVTDLKKKSPLF